jgi:hypothetical protein
VTAPRRVVILFSVRPRPPAPRHWRRHRTLSRLPAGVLHLILGPAPAAWDLVNLAGRPGRPRPLAAPAASHPRASSRSSRSTHASPATAATPLAHYSHHLLTVMGPSAPPSPARVYPASRAPPR